MRENPWMSVDLFTNEVKWYATEKDAAIDNINKPVDIQYRPGRKKVVKKNG